MAALRSIAVRAGLIGFVGCWVACGGKSSVERDGGAPDAGGNAGDASTGGASGTSGDAGGDAGADADADADADSGEAAECIPSLGSCQGGLLCCSGEQCTGDGCGIDPGCASPGAACGGGIDCCEGNPCGADGKCPAVTCHGIGKTCGSASALPCCSGLVCHPNGWCYDPTPCSLKGDPCGKGCCSGLACDSAGLCAGSVACLSAPGACFTCLASSCCSQLAQCQSVIFCSAQLSCLTSCTAGGTSLSECEYICGSTGVLLEAIDTCATAQCAAPCE